MFLGLDLGTTNVKAAVADRDCRVVATGSAPVTLYPSESGGAEQDIEEIWKGATCAIRQLAQQVRAQAIEAVGISSQGGAMQITDRDGRPVGRVISWLDQRGRTYDEDLTRELGAQWFLDRIRHGRSALAIGQLLRLRKENPEWLRRPNRIGFVGDVIVSRLCGRACQDGTSAALTLLYDPAGRRYSGDLLARLGVSAEQLPVLVPPNEAAGTLLPEVASELGLPANIPVSTAIHDQYASALGTGAVQAGTVMLGTGTAWVLLAVSEALPMPVHADALISHHLLDRLYGQIISMVNGGSAFSWALQTLGLSDRPRAAIDALLDSVDPASDGMVCWPWFSGATPTGVAGRNRGAFDGLQLGHGPAHILRAVVEGLACELNRHLAFLRDAGQPIARLTLGGGAAASTVTPQILANITNLPITCFHEGESSLLGAVILARSLVERDKSLAEIVSTARTPHSRVEPGHDTTAYATLYSRYLEGIAS